MAETRIDPMLIDINLVSSIGFQKHMTDYVDMLLTFPDEVMANIVYWHTYSHSDPTSSKIEFFKQLNNKELKTKEPENNTNIPNKTTEEKLYNKNIRDQLLPNQFLSTSDGIYGEPEVSGETTKTKVKSYTKIWESVQGDQEITSDGNWTIQNEEPAENQAPVVDRTQFQQEEIELQDTFGMEDMSAWFKLWWMEKFNSSHEIIRRDLRELLGDDNEYFVNFSESVGQLKNLTDTQNTSTTPVIDANVEAFGDKSLPNIIPGVAAYITKPENVGLAAEISTLTNKTFRTNIMTHMDDCSRDEVVPLLAELPVNPHGCNLIHDSEHPKRMSQFIETVREEIENHLKGLYDVLELLSNRENYIVMAKPRQILLKVEQFTKCVDLFKNKIKSFTLTDEDMTLSRFGKATHFNNQYKNVDYLAVPGVVESSSESEE
jgi:hypothetical protein